MLVFQGVPSLQAPAALRGEMLDSKSLELAENTYPGFRIAFARFVGDSIDWMFGLAAVRDPVCVDAADLV